MKKTNTKLLNRYRNSYQMKNRNAHPSPKRHIKDFSFTVYVTVGSGGHGTTFQNIKRAERYAKANRPSKIVINAPEFGGDKTVAAFPVLPWFVTPD